MRLPLLMNLKSTVSTSLQSKGMLHSDPSQQLPPSLQYLNSALSQLTETLPKASFSHSMYLKSCHSGSKGASKQGPLNISQKVVHCIAGDLYTGHAQLQSMLKPSHVSSISLPSPSHLYSLPFIHLTPLLTSFTTLL